jgi:sugar phosphate isomerase/epimerase
MRLGVAGEIIPRNLSDVTEVVAERLASFGFTGVGTHFLGEPETIPATDLHRVRDLLAAHGIRVAQSWGWHQPLVHPDDTVRRAGVRRLQHAVRVAADLGAVTVMSGPGSRSSAGPWSPHPDNHSPEAEDALVDSLQEAAIACATYGVPIALECHVVSTLDSPARVQRVLERVGSEWVGVSLDPVNFIADLPTLYNTTALLDDLFDRLGPKIYAAHVKDAYVEDRLVVHISETAPGRGVFDLDTFFRRFDATCPDGYALIEHLPDDLVPEATAYVRGRIEQLGIELRV